MKKVCNFCGNKNVKAAAVQYIYKHNDQFMIVDNVPCEQCEYCGEKYFKSSVLKKIESDFTAVYSDNKKVTRKVMVPIEQFA